MLQEWVAQAGAGAWAVGSMFFFLIAWVAVVVWMIGKRPEELEAHARLPLEADPEKVQESARVRVSKRRPWHSSKTRSSTT